MKWTIITLALIASLSGSSQAFATNCWGDTECEQREEQTNILRRIEQNQESIRSDIVIQELHRESDRQDLEDKWKEANKKSLFRDPLYVNPYDENGQVRQR